tara:strand:- start:4649 stop:5302 length:654 start_codon:yes stop_codon:yes gene_type:complete
MAAKDIPEAGPMPAPYNWKDHLLTAGSSTRPFTRDPMAGTAKSATQGFEDRVGSAQHRALKEAYNQRLAAAKEVESSRARLDNRELQEKQADESRQALFASSRGGQYGGKAYLDAVQMLGRKHGLQKQGVTGAAIQAGQQARAQAQQQYGAALNLGAGGGIGGTAPLSDYRVGKATYPFRLGKPGIAGVGWPKIVAPKKPVEEKKDPVTEPPGGSDR